MGIDFLPLGCEAPADHGVRPMLVGPQKPNE
jgi:hypothetical protein